MLVCSWGVKLGCYTTCSPHALHYMFSACFVFEFKLDKKTQVFLTTNCGSHTIVSIVGSPTEAVCFKTNCTMKRVSTCTHPRHRIKPKWTSVSDYNWNLSEISNHSNRCRRAAEHTVAVDGANMENMQPVTTCGLWDIYNEHLEQQNICTRSTCKHDCWIVPSSGVAKHSPHLKMFLCHGLRSTLLNENVFLLFPNIPLLVW